MILILAIMGLFSASLTFQPVVASIWCLLTGIAARIEVLSAEDVRLGECSSFRDSNLKLTTE
jgi:hypothetical protein